MNPQFYTLPNGLSVIFVDTKAFPTLTTLLLIGAGSRYENTENNGVAHFFEHMAFKGSKKYPSSLIISSVIEGLGGVFNAFTAKDHTGYWIKAPTEDFEAVIDVLSDMVMNPLLIEGEIEKEKGVIVEEINLYEDTPYRQVGEIFEKVLYDGHPLGYEITGTKKSVKAFTRKTFVDYINKLYHPRNLVLVVAGGFPQLPGGETNFSPFKKLIEEKFVAWKNGTKAEFPNINECQNSPQIYVKSKKTEQAHFCLGFRTFSFFDARKHALSVLSTILGGGMSSRLFVELRERRGLCYYISTGRELYHDAGNLVTQAGVTNSVEKVKESVEITLNEHRKIAKGELTKEELNNAKELLKGRLLISMEDSSNVASFFGSRKLLQNSLETPQETIKKIESVNFDDVVSLAKQLFVPERLNFAMVGPFENKSEFKEVLEGF